METKITMEKLNNNNYYNWKFKMKNFLIREDLWDLISNADDRPTTSTLLAAWNKKDKKAAALICLAADDSQIVHLREKETALESWEALQKAHQIETMTNKISLYKKIGVHKIKEETTMEQHINEMTELFQKLQDLGEATPKEWKIGILFTSLGPEYSTLVTALEARDEKELKFSLVQSKLLDEYMRRQKRS